MVPLDDQGHLQALQHVEGIGVGTHAHQDTLVDHLKHRGAAHRVAHVGLRVVHHHGAGFLYNVHFRRVYVDAVAQQGLGPQNALVQQPVHAAGTVFLQGIVYVVHALGHVDVEAGTAIVGLDHLLKGFIRNGE